MTLDNALIDRGSHDPHRRGADQRRQRRHLQGRLQADGRLGSARPASRALILDVRTCRASKTPGRAQARHATCWDPAARARSCLVRAYYKWPLITPLLQKAVG
jgi:hypothetical protein